VQILASYCLELGVGGAVHVVQGDLVTDREAIYPVPDSIDNASSLVSRNDGKGDVGSEPAVLKE